ncbi:uncharacterized protein LOC113466936 [Diaphorina citri]|uniref:Uncharacterized protein LOC113466936 n=1 Tax=Diaphorina citri TaxID=121845 RepID=A0A3Q0IQP0_DIACI|nr:uncharacterized protein LOC113466936 [Diaphorina citri]
MDSFLSESDSSMCKSTSMSILNNTSISHQSRQSSSSNSLHLFKSTFHANVLTPSNRLETSAKARTLFRNDHLSSNLKLNDSHDYMSEAKRQAVTCLDLSEVNESLCEKQLPDMDVDSYASHRPCLDQNKYLRQVRNDAQLVEDNVSKCRDVLPVPKNVPPDMDVDSYASHRPCLDQNKYLRQVRNDAQLVEDNVSKCSDKSLFKSPTPRKIYTRTRILPNGDLVFILPPTLTTSDLHGVSCEDLSTQPNMWRPW